MSEIKIRDTRIQYLEEQLIKKWDTSTIIGLIGGFSLGVLFMLILKIFIGF